MESPAIAMHTSCTLLKHPDEVDALRKVYGQALFIISVYSPRHTRLSALSDRISRSRQQYAADLYSDKVEQLIEKDEQELGNPFGQNVRETFPLGDIFIDCTELKRAQDQITTIHRGFVFEPVYYSDDG